jgi:hypothetical protein
MERIMRPSTNIVYSGIRGQALHRMFTWSGIVGLLLLLVSTANPQELARPYKITVKDEQDKVVEPVLPVDPGIHIKLTSGPGMTWGLKTPDGKRLVISDHSAFVRFKIDGGMIHPGGQTMPLPPKKGSKIPRHGALYQYQFKDLHITHTQEIVPGKPPGLSKPGQKRKMDTVVFKYVIENKGNNETKFAMRVGMDAYNWTTDGPPLGIPGTGKVLDGAFVEGKEVPEYAINMQMRDFKNPGHVAYFTFDQGGKWERPSKVVVSSHGSAYVQNWEVPITPNQFDTDFIFYWAEKPLRPKEKRVIIYGYGTSLATNPDNEGRMTTAFGGSFEPGKSFTLTAYVDDPPENQNLTLVLPKGMKLLEGKETQPVPAVDNDNRSVVTWKCRVLATGTHALQIQSSTGVTLTKTVTVEKTKSE